MDIFLLGNMAKVQHYRGLNTNLDRLYDSIKAELQDQKDLEMVSEYKGEMNGKPLRSIVAVNKSLKVFAGSLREIHVSILGTPTIMLWKLLQELGLEAFYSPEQLG
jgi:hypothetical protein